MRLGARHSSGASRTALKIMSAAWTWPAVQHDHAIFTRVNLPDLTTS